MRSRVRHRASCLTPPTLSTARRVVLMRVRTVSASGVSPPIALTYRGRTPPDDGDVGAGVAGWSGVSRSMTTAGRGPGPPNPAGPGDRRSALPAVRAPLEPWSTTTDGKGPTSPAAGPGDRRSAAVSSLVEPRSVRRTLAAGRSRRLPAEPRRSHWNDDGLLTAEALGLDCTKRQYNNTRCYSQIRIHLFC